MSLSKHDASYSTSINYAYSKVAANYPINPYGASDEPEVFPETCGYMGFISDVPMLSGKYDPQERRIRRYAIQLEGNVEPNYTMGRLIELKFSLELFQKYEIRRRLQRYLYNMNTAKLALLLVRKIRHLERIAAAAEEAMNARLAVTPPSTGTPSPPQENKENVFLSGKINVSSTLDHLLRLVKNQK